MKMGHANRPIALERHHSNACVTDLLQENGEPWSSIQETARNHNARQTSGYSSMRPQTRNRHDNPLLLMRRAGPGCAVPNAPASRNSQDSTHGAPAQPAVICITTRPFCYQIDMDRPVLLAMHNA
jgi:hypothetical protein